MPDYATPQRNWLPGQTVPTARRMNELADQGTRVARDQRTFRVLEEDFGPIPRGRFMIITSCSRQSGIAKVRKASSITLTAGEAPTGQVDTNSTAENAWNGCGAWHEKNDLVTVVPFRAKLTYGSLNYDIKWLVVDKDMFANYNNDPASDSATLAPDNLQDHPGIRAVCEDSV